MFKRNNILYEVGDIVIVCWGDKQGTHEARGRLVQVKSDIRPPYTKPYIKFIVETSGRIKDRLSFALNNDLHIEKVEV